MPSDERKRPVSSGVLDASALLALILGEPGGDRVASEVSGHYAAVSAVNLAEVVGRYCDLGAPEAVVHAAIDPLRLDVIPFDAECAYRVARLRPVTRRAGLSLGDRACLALAQRLGLPALTMDRVWADLPLGIQILVMR